VREFKGKWALITGAASGLGLALARKAADLGMSLLLVDMNPEGLRTAVQVIAESRTGKLLEQEIHSFVVDVSSSEQMQALCRKVQDQHVIPHLLFNNAGVAAGGLIWEHSPQEWQRILGVNLMGVVNGIHHFIPLMLECAARDSKWQGHIINTASMAGLLTPPNMGLYNVSKHAVVALTETLYQDLALVSEQLSTSVLCPYFIPTQINQNFNASQSSGHSPAPLTQSQIVGRQMLDKAVSSGKVSAQDLAQIVFEAIENNRFYIFSHPQALDNVQLRMQAILEQKQPPDPFSKKPELGLQLRNALGSKLL
jgi:NAD(P)-dependent dehydrogenase (short-subunit alcohol dehydrogenase family)